VEDIAYSLIGLFGVNIPLLYGEGSKAFLRLQEEILRQTDDETIFAWTTDNTGGYGLLAPSPAEFYDSANIRKGKPFRERSPYKQTNLGLEIECQMLPIEMNTYVIPLNCERRKADSEAQQLVIFLCRTMQDYQYSRISFHGKSLRDLGRLDITGAKVSTVFVPNDAHVLDLLPHGGLPLVHIDSYLHAWSLEPRTNYKGLIIEPEHVNRGTELTTIASPNEQPRVPRVPRVPPARHDLESGTAINSDLEGSDPVQGACTIQKQVPQIQFRRKDLKKGRMVAFTRMSTSRPEFYYYVELGFDMEFNPVCFLHVRRFTTIPASWSYWPRSRNLVPKPSWVKCELLLPMCGSFWTDGRCTRVKSKTDATVKLFSGRSI
jgi:hypothetical protein